MPPVFEKIAIAWVILLQSRAAVTSAGEYRSQFPIAVPIPSSRIIARTRTRTREDGLQMAHKCPDGVSRCFAGEVGDVNEVARAGG